MSGPGNADCGEGSSAASGPSSSTSTSTSTSASGYTLPVGPLISRNLSYMLNLPHLPPLPQIRSLLIASEPATASRPDGPQEQSPSQVQLQERIKFLTNTQQEREALLELRQALALSVSSAKDELPSSSTALQGEEEEGDTASWKTLEESLTHRLLLASCYTLSTPPHLHEAKHELEVARASLRAWVSPPALASTGAGPGAGAGATTGASSATGSAATTKERRAARVERSRAWSGDLLLALANVVEMQGGSREEVKRLMGWREKALNAK